MERVLGARLVYAKGSMARALSFEYLNRQLVWHELSELLLFLLPLLNVARLKSMVLSYLPHIVPSLQTSAAEGRAACTLYLYIHNCSTTPLSHSELSNVVTGTSAGGMRRVPM